VHQAANDRLTDTRWSGIEHYSRPAKPLIQPLVPEHKSVVRDLRFQPTTMMFPMHATQFENIGKIGIELDRQNKINSRASVVMNAKPFVTRFIPQDLGAEHVYRSPRNYYLAVTPDIGVGSVDS